MKPLSRSPLFAFLLTIIFFACQKQVNIDLSPDPGETGGSYTGNQVQASFQGRVLTATGAPVMSAKVSAGGAFTFTDQYGVFTLPNVETDEQFGYVRVEKEGYLAGSRTVLTRKASMNFVEIRLMKKILQGSFQSGVAATISVENEVTVAFPENSVVTTAGTEYTGEVNVYGAVIDPTATNFAGIMPGDLRGIRTNDDVTALISYGMIAVELEGESGQKLQLAPDKKATISMPIPESLLTSAPSTIPMWHFSDEKGYWIEEGEGVKNGSKYVGQVSHFSTWNYDVPANFIKLSLQLLRSTGEAVAYKEIKIYQADNDSYYNTALTDSAGSVQMWVPVGTPLKMKVVGSCDQALDSTVIGPFDTNTDLGAVTFSPSPGTVVKGRVVDCNSMPVADGVVKLSIEGLNYRVSAQDGEFAFNLDLCISGSSLTGTIKAQSAQLLKESEPSAIDISAGVTDVGEIKICSDIDTALVEFVKCTIGNTNYTYNALVDSFTTNLIGPYTFVKVFGNNPGADMYSKTIFVELPDTIPGTYVRNSGSYITGPDSISYNTSFMLNNGNDRYRLFLSDTITWNITNYGMVGEMIEATFSTRAVREGIPDVKIPASGEIRIRREH